MGVDVSAGVRSQLRRDLAKAGLYLEDTQITLADGTVLDGSGGAGGDVDRLTNPTLAVVPGLSNGDVWVEASGTTPNRSLALKVRDGGVTYTLAEIIV